MNNSVFPIALVGILGIWLGEFIFLDQPGRPVYHPQLQSVELPQPLLQLLSPKKKQIFDFHLQASCQQVGNRHQNFPIFDKSISYLSHLTMKPRIKETKI